MKATLSIIATILILAGNALGLELEMYGPVTEVCEFYSPTDGTPHYKECHTIPGPKVGTIEIVEIDGLVYLFHKESGAVFLLQVPSNTQLTP